MIELLEQDSVESTVLISRNYQEAFRIQEGETDYEILARCMEISQQQIDAFAKFCGRLAGDAIIDYRQKKDYHNDKNGNMINWVHRNIYQDPVKTEKCQAKDATIGTAISLATEGGIKYGMKVLHDYMKEKDKYQRLEQVYAFLNNYAMTDAAISNSKRAQLELAKIRNGFPLSDKKKKNIYEENKGKTAIELEAIPSMSVLNNNPELCETIAYQLFVLYCQKFGDSEGILAEELGKRNYNYKGMDTLFSYYDYLGFTGNYAKELIRVNANRYNKICTDQVYYLQLGRKIISEFTLNIPGIDLHSIHEHCKCMAKYDPYQLRRKKVQNVGAGLAVGLAGLLAKRPDIVLNGGALALSQFVLEDGDIPTIMQREFKKNGVELDEFNFLPLLWDTPEIYAVVLVV